MQKSDHQVELYPSLNKQLLRDLFGLSSLLKGLFLFHRFQSYRLLVKSQDPSLTGTQQWFWCKALCQIPSQKECYLE